MSKRCPFCGSEANGNFCSQCGASLTAVRSCSACGSEIPTGGRFCNMCGLAVAEGAAAAAPSALAQVGAPPPRGPQSAPAHAATPPNQPERSFPWMVAAGVALLVLVVAFFGFPMRSEDLAVAPPQPSVGPSSVPVGGGAASVDLSSMTAREAADRLFNRIMLAASSGDTTQARTFAPMALAAYDLIDDPDIDVHYHLALIHLVNGDAAAARAESDAILAQTPTHLFGLLTGAQAARLAGDSEEARSLYQQLLNNYEAEVAGGRPEYFDHHEAALQPMRAEASAYLNGQN